METTRCYYSFLRNFCLVKAKEDERHASGESAFTIGSARRVLMMMMMMMISKYPLSRIFNWGYYGTRVRLYPSFGVWCFILTLRFPFHDLLAARGKYDGYYCLSVLPLLSAYLSVKQFCLLRSDVMRLRCL